MDAIYDHLANLDVRVLDLLQNKHTPLGLFHSGASPATPQDSSTLSLQSGANSKTIAQFLSTLDITPDLITSLDDEEFAAAIGPAEAGLPIAYTPLPTAGTQDIASPAMNEGLKSRTLMVVPAHRPAGEGSLNPASGMLANLPQARRLTTNRFVTSYPPDRCLPTTAATFPLYPEWPDEDVYLESTRAANATIRSNATGPYTIHWDVAVHSIMSQESVGRNPAAWDFPLLFNTHKSPKEMRLMWASDPTATHTLCSAVLADYRLAPREEVHAQPVVWTPELIRFLPRYTGRGSERDVELARPHILPGQLAAAYAMALTTCMAVKCDAGALLLGILSWPASVFTSDPVPATSYIQLGKLVHHAYLNSVGRPVRATTTGSRVARAQRRTYLRATPTLPLNLIRWGLQDVGKLLPPHWAKPLQTAGVTGKPKARRQKPNRHERKARAARPGHAADATDVVDLSAFEAGAREGLVEQAKRRTRKVAPRAKPRTVQREIKLAEKGYAAAYLASVSAFSGKGPVVRDKLPAYKPSSLYYPTSVADVDRAITKLLENPEEGDRELSKWLQTIHIPDEERRTTPNTSSHLSWQSALVLPGTYNSITEFLVQLPDNLTKQQSVRNLGSADPIWALTCLTRPAMEAYLAQLEAEDPDFDPNGRTITIGSFYLALRPDELPGRTIVEQGARAPLPDARRSGEIPVYMGPKQSQSLNMNTLYMNSLTAAHSSAASMAEANTGKVVADQLAKMIRLANKDKAFCTGTLRGQLARLAIQAETRTKYNKKPNPGSWASLPYRITLDFSNEKSIKAWMRRVDYITPNLGSEVGMTLSTALTSWRQRSLALPTDDPEPWFSGLDLVPTGDIEEGDAWSVSATPEATAVVTSTSAPRHVALAKKAFSSVKRSNGTLPAELLGAARFFDQLGELPDRDLSRYLIVQPKPKAETYDRAKLADKTRSIYVTDSIAQILMQMLYRYLLSVADGFKPPPMLPPDSPPKHRILDAKAMFDYAEELDEAGTDGPSYATLLGMDRKHFHTYVAMLALGYLPAEAADPDVNLVVRQFAYSDNIYYVIWQRDPRLVRIISMDGVKMETANRDTVAKKFAADWVDTYEAPVTLGDILDADRGWGPGDGDLEEFIDLCVSTGEGTFEVAPPDDEEPPHPPLHPHAFLNAENPVPGYDHGIAHAYGLRFRAEGVPEEFTLDTEVRAEPLHPNMTRYLFDFYPRYLEDSVAVLGHHQFRVPLMPSGLQMTALFNTLTSLTVISTWHKDIKLAKTADEVTAILKDKAKNYHDDSMWTYEFDADLQLQAYHAGDVFHTDVLGYDLIKTRGCLCQHLQEDRLYPVLAFYKQKASPTVNRLNSTATVIATWFLGAWVKPAFAYSTLPYLHLIRHSYATPLVLDPKIIQVAINLALGSDATQMIDVAEDVELSTSERWVQLYFRAWMSNVIVDYGPSYAGQGLKDHQKNLMLLDTYAIISAVAGRDEAERTYRSTFAMMYLGHVEGKAEPTDEDIRAVLPPLKVKQGELGEVPALAPWAGTAKGLAALIARLGMSAHKYPKNKPEIRVHLAAFGTAMLQIAARTSTQGYATIWSPDRIIEAFEEVSQRDWTLFE